MINEEKGDAMCEKEQLAVFKDLFKEIMNRGYGTMDKLRQEVQKVYEDLKDVPQEEWDAEVKRTLQEVSLLSLVINDIIHFGHKSSLDLFPVENKPFIEHAIKMQQEAIDKRSVTCSCCEETAKEDPLSEELNDN